MLRFPLIALAISFSAMAAGDDKEKWQEPCQLDEQTQLELNQCADRWFQAHDAKLNRVYKTTMQSLTAEQQERLRKEQRAWLKSRDADCSKETAAEADGGSIWPMLYSLCLADATERRTKQLRKWTP